MGIGEKKCYVWEREAEKKGGATKGGFEGGKSPFGLFSTASNERTESRSIKGYILGTEFETFMKLLLSALVFFIVLQKRNRYSTYHTKDESYLSYTYYRLILSKQMEKHHIVHK